MKTMTMTIAAQCWISECLSIIIFMMELEEVELEAEAE